MAALRLARIMRYPNVDRMLDEMTGPQVEEQIALFHLEHNAERTQKLVDSVEARARG